MPRSRRNLMALLSAATVSGAVVVLLDLVVAPLTGHFSGEFEDFRPILQAGRAANLGADPYAPFIAHAPTALVVSLGFDYMPLVAVLARPLAALPQQVAQTLWLWCILGATIAASVIAARVALPPSWPRTAVGFCAALLYAPADYNVWHGQMNALVLLSLALALRAWVRGDQVGCGIALGLGGVAKVAPAALLLLMVRRRWWRGLLAGAGTLGAALVAGGALLGFDRVRDWVTQVLPVLGRADGWYFNQSAGALLSRLAGHSIFRLGPPDPGLQVLVVTTSAACLLSAALLVRPGAASTERRKLEYAAAVVAMVLAGAVAWWDDYSSLLIPLLILAGLAAAGRVGRAPVAAGGLLLVVAGIATPIFLALGGNQWVLGTHGSGWWFPAVQLESLPGLAAVVLLACLLVAASRPWPGTSPAPASPA